MSELSPYEIAFLSGGPTRVAQTALLALYESDRIRVSRGTHRVEVLPREPEDLHPVQAAVIDQVPGTGRLLGAVLEAVAAAPEVRAVADALVSGGLLRAGLRGALRPTGEGKALRRGFETSPGEGDVLRLAALGPEGVQDAKMREILSTDDPKPVKMPKKPKGGHRDLDSSGLSDTQYSAGL
ncbi:TIGR04222 domain-containing membrane protein [Actinomadura graeca]|uniref:TIGR04222 domain-containing membrane protein n=1 Tax=Actinomadura graeca TaxID=2750812 RepID=A0ABX8QPF0_9ACTN|nr:TIGR04222 domain-containing membrane protein [Actinomadura graeca]QXJ20551.1 TIGR04222 domain-containing membrane protein [Actinomadura graeca]